MSKRASWVVIVVAIIGALAGAVLIIANAPQGGAGATPTAAFGH